MVDPDDDDDSFPNDFDGLDFDSIPGLQAPGGTPVASTSRGTVPLSIANPAPSPESDAVVDMDPAFLAEVDALEARALGKMSRDLSSTKLDLSADAKKSATSPNKSKGVPRSTDLPSVNRKGKGKAESKNDIGMRAALAGYEAELTCPICCDLLVGAQVTNPCGHTCCGVCIHEWLQRNKYEPSCPVCRSRLSTRRPLLPNFSMDSLVHQHLQILAKSGCPEWRERGYKTIEWNNRFESWKKQATVRAAKEKVKESSRPRRRRTRHYEVGDYSYSIDEDPEDAIVMHVSPRRTPRARV